MKLKYWYLVVLISFLACNSKNNTETKHKEAIPNSHQQGNTKNGKYISYDTSGRKTREDIYDNGSLKSYITYDLNGNTRLSVRTISNDTIYETWFYSNGNIESEGKSVNNIPIGEWKLYDTMSRITLAREYIIINGKYHINEFRYYDEVGNIRKDISNYLIINSNKDTLAKGEELRISIQLIPMFRKEMRVSIGNYDGNYKLIDSTNLVKLGSKDYLIKYSLKAKQKGWGSIKGIVEDVGIDSIRYMYFHKSYYVK